MNSQRQKLNRVRWAGTLLKPSFDGVGGLKAGVRVVSLPVADLNMNTEDQVEGSGLYYYDVDTTYHFQAVRRVQKCVC